MRKKWIPTIEYVAWTNMKSRCYNSNNKCYHHYGGRGIEVCNEWLNNYPQFLQDMGEKPKGYELDRIDNNKGYSKENCRWIDHTTNNRNRRNTRRVSINNVEYSIRELSEEYNLKYQLICDRWKRGLRGKELIKPPTK